MKWLPSRKWLAAQAVAGGAIATSAIDSGWDATEWKLVVGWAVQALVTYLLPNASEAPAPAVMESMRKPIRGPR